MNTDALSGVIEAALKRCHDRLETTDWQGRENELVNLFAQHCLVMEMVPGGPLHSSSQLGIEVAVPQVSGSIKRFVRKDLVIWPEPLMTAWSGTPAAIVEWKRDRISHCTGDIEWLKQFTRQYPETVGYSVCGFIKGQRGICYTKVQNGESLGMINWRQ
jgi:hypothetical protein